MGRNLRILCVGLVVMFMVACVNAAGVDSWWQPVSGPGKDNPWHYRIPVKVTALPGLNYEGYPIELAVDFRRALDTLGKSAETPDLPNSLRLIAADSGRGIACQYDDLRYKKRRDDPGNGRGNLVFVVDRLTGGRDRKYYLYFDTVEAGGHKEKVGYPDIQAVFDQGKNWLNVDTGKILVGLKFGKQKYCGHYVRHGIKRLAIKHPEKNIGIPIYVYGVDSFGMNRPPFEAELIKGPVFVRCALTCTTKTTKVDEKGNFLSEDSFTKKLSLTFFNNSAIWYVDRIGGTINFMGPGFFVSYQDNFMPASGSIDELRKEKYGRVQHSARYGVATSADGYSLATCITSNTEEGRKKQPASLTWGNANYLRLPQWKVSQNSRIKHNLTKGGIETAKVLDEPPVTDFDEKKIERNDNIMFQTL